MNSEPSTPGRESIMPSPSGPVRRTSGTYERPDVPSPAVRWRVAYDLRADAEYLRAFPPLKVEPFAGSKKDNRTVLVELFTGAQCPPCVAADIAFELVGLIIGLVRSPKRVAGVESRGVFPEHQLAVKLIGARLGKNFNAAIAKVVVLG